MSIFGDPVLTGIAKASASGPIASFPDGAKGLPLRSLVANIEPVQEGTGDPSPDNVRPISGWSEVNVRRTGKNLLNPAERTIITTNIKYYYNNPIKLPAGTYTLSISEKVNGVYVNAEGAASIFTKYNTNFITFTLTGEYYIHFNFYKNGGINPNDTCQLELGSNATAYEPYSGNQYTLQLGQTVYGGTLDVTSGVLTVTHEEVDLGTLTWAITTNRFEAGLPLPPPIYSSTQIADAICSAYPIVSRSALQDKTACIYYGNVNGVNVRDSDYSTAADFKSAISGVQLVYELATPITIQLTPTEITTLLGQNNIWADTGDVDVEYLKRSLTYIGSYIH